MSELVKRSITGAVYVIATVGAALAGPVTTSLLFLPVCVLGAAELETLLSRTEKDSAPSPFNLGMVTAAYVVVALLGIAEYSRGAWLAAGVLLLLILMSMVHALRGPLQQMPRSLGRPVVGILFWGLPLALIPTLMQAGGTVLFLGFLILLWTNDTGAYIAGRSFGRTPLIPRISPNKTVEGLIGGIVLTGAAAALISRAWPTLGLTEWLICALVISLTATLGDLLESALKRLAGVKDSGWILPGHGGILDRFDGFILALPAMLVIVRLLA